MSNLFNGHTMSVVTDLRMIGNEINNMDFMSVAAITTGDYPQHPNIYNAAILIPPTPILMDWADGNPTILQSEYPKYLLTKDPDDMITALIAAMTKRNIILYIPNDEFNVFGQMLLNHIYFVYGITCNFVRTQFSFDATKVPYLISKFYMIDVMEANDYLESYPATALLPEFVINKLAAELRPFNRPATFMEYADYFNKLNASKMVNKPLQNMVQIVGDKNDSVHR